MQSRRWFVAAMASLPVARAAVQNAAAQTVVDSPELYPGEKALFEAALKEGMVVSFDTGPTWANWAAQFAAFKKRYPEVEIVYNDIGSGATVVALDKAYGLKIPDPEAARQILQSVATMAEAVARKSGAAPGQ